MLGGFVMVVHMGHVPTQQPKLSTLRRTIKRSAVDEEEKAEPDPLSYTDKANGHRPRLKAPLARTRHLSGIEEDERSSGYAGPASNTSTGASRNSSLASLTVPANH